jgi:uncharacterized protein YbjQ (UPF0145 family)
MSSACPTHDSPIEVSYRHQEFAHSEEQLRDCRRQPLSPHVAAALDLVAGRSATYERALAEARDIAFAEMQKRAEALGANGIIGIDLDYEVLGQANGMLMVSCSGTAVIC